MISRLRSRVLLLWVRGLALDKLAPVEGDSRAPVGVEWVP